MTVCLLGNQGDEIWIYDLVASIRSDSNQPKTSNNVISVVWNERDYVSVLVISIDE